MFAELSSEPRAIEGLPGATKRTLFVDNANGDKDSSADTIAEEDKHKHTQMPYK